VEGKYAVKLDSVGESSFGGPNFEKRLAHSIYVGRRIIQTRLKCCFDGYASFEP
jgi:hypothetical protein